MLYNKHEALSSNASPTLKTEEKKRMSGGRSFINKDLHHLNEEKLETKLMK
jgi:hypothetical protein